MCGIGTFNHRRISLSQQTNKRIHRLVADRLTELNDPRLIEWRKAADELLITLCAFRDTARDLLDRFSDDLTVSDFEKWSSAAYDLCHETFLIRCARNGLMKTRISKALEHITETRRYWIDLARRLSFHGTEIHLSFREIQERLVISEAKLRLLADS